MARSGRLTFKIRLLEHMYRMDYPSLHGPPGAADWPSMNVDVDKHSIKRRCGYVADRTLKTVAKPYDIIKFGKRDGTVETLILTDTDLLKRETASGKTFSYLTQSYTTGTIASITTVTVEGTGGMTWSASGIAADDEFIMTDDYTSDVEHDANWTPIASVTDDDTLVLDTAYTKNGTAYRIRQIYSLPSGERWNYAVVSYKFCFTSGNINVQYYGGSGTADDLDATNAKKARYCIEYANRLVLADLEISSTREPWTIQYSKNGDPTDWTDSTAGSIDLLESQDIIKGLARVGSSLIIFKEDSFHIAHRTGISTAPIAIPTHKKGVGCYAPYSIVHVESSVMWLGRDDFYMMNGDHPEPTGEYIWDKFKEIVGEEAKKQIFGFWNPQKNHVIWMADTEEGQIAFVYDYKRREWGTYRYWEYVYGLGEG